MAIAGTITKPHVVSGLVEHAVGQVVVVIEDDGWGLDEWGSGEWGGGTPSEVETIGGRIWGKVN